MAIINNLKAKLTSFKVNDTPSRLINCVGTYGTVDILNGGELLEDTLEFTFKVTGLQGHIIKSIVINSLLLTFDGELSTSRNLTMKIKDFGNQFTGMFNVNDSVKTITSTEFVQQEEQKENEKEIVLTVSMNSTNTCYYGLQSIIINLYDIDYALNISFTGPKEGRTVSSIQAAALLVNQNAENVTFSKDPLNNFNSETDSVEGRLYLRKDGIYVDGYQYGVNVEASESKIGLVKLKNDYEINPEGGIIIDNQSGIAATPQLIINTLNKITNFIDNGIIPPADTESFGFVKLRDSFETFIDEETGESGIIAPNENGVAASTLLVYNTINTLKTYTDELVEGIPIPSIELEDNTIEQIKEDYIFSNDFERDADNKIYIKWLEIN